MKKFSDWELVKELESYAKEDETLTLSNTQVLALIKLYKNLRKAIINEVKNGDLTTGRKLQKILQIEQWW